MASNPPALLLKGVWLLHFVLSSWAMLSGFIAVATYFYTHLLVLAIGLWAIIDASSADAIIMFMGSLMVSVLNDIILLGIYEPRGHDNFEDGNPGTGKRNEYRFALGMCITNLLLKPISLFLLYRIYQSRSDGSEFNSGIPGIGGGGSHGGYDDITPSNTSSKEPPLYNEPGYQQPPQ
ncbi:type-1 angiotensin ii receptor-associated protein-like [Plakobranchus ocellatus]|uniref:Type-1 angiotensin ii receptor-associated protein-like n=1 Tax=Plakobranchus ocellatus TaxID=259542 RepID=A0AAV4CTU4_9GAST|nr:type-1 angiotensin ii receptor-associated protein-like [Plakobranchus ocellatus]